MYGTRVRVVVLGAGIIGAACARELALAGLEVTLLDRGGATAATTSHGEGNVLVSDKGPGPELRLAQLSRRLWPEALAEIAERSRPGGGPSKPPNGTPRAASSSPPPRREHTGSPSSPPRNAAPKYGPTR